jgi:hypothetical protein
MLRGEDGWLLGVGSYFAVVVKSATVSLQAKSDMVT